MPMPKRLYPETPLLAAATAIWRGDRILLARRKVSVNSGTWAMPGGLVETGETLVEAAIREVKEETSLTISSPKFMTYHEIIMKDDEGAAERHYVLAIFVAKSESGLAVAGDDADAVSWFEQDELHALPLTGNTLSLVRESTTLLADL